MKKSPSLEELVMSPYRIAFGTSSVGLDTMSSSESLASEPRSLSGSVNVVDRHQHRGSTTSNDTWSFGGSLPCSPKKFHMDTLGKIKVMM